MKPVIKWSGSKRSQSDELKKYIPTDYKKYYEPFVGGGAMLYAINPSHAICGDICEPLISLWQAIKNRPQSISDAYRDMWNELQDKGQDFYYQTREEFNNEHLPEQLLFLSRTCTNGLIRFNRKGVFNNSFHLNRPGINPDTLEGIIMDWTKHIQNAEFFHQDYVDSLKSATKDDFVYLDPPYFNTKGMYFGTIDYNRFLDCLEDLNNREIRFALSYDGKRGDENLEVDLPKNLYKRHVLIDSGISSFNRLQNKHVFVQESLYLNY